MLSQLVIASLSAVISVAITSMLIVFGIRLLKRGSTWISTGGRIWRSITAVCLTTLWLLFTATVSAWIWASVLLWVGAFAALEPALYFSVVTMTTLGYGDIVPGEEWRLIAGVCAANGLLLFGLYAAFLVELFRQLIAGMDD